MAAGIHPTRVGIIDHLERDGALSPNELSARLGTTLGATSYHVRKLHAEGALTLVDERRVRGAIEHFYELADDAGRPEAYLLDERELLERAAVRLAKSRAPHDRTLAKRIREHLER